MHYKKQDIEKQRVALMKESMKERIRKRIYESRPQNIANVEQVMKFKGRRPKSIRARINQIYKIIKAYGIDNKLYTDDHWQAKDDYSKAIESLGCEFNYWCENGGYCDYDNDDHMPRSKKYEVEITFEDGMTIGGYMKFMAAGTIENPFKRYDTCIVLDPSVKHELTTESIQNTVAKTIKNYLNEEEGDEYVIDDMGDDEEIDDFERYQQDYSDDGFDPNDITEDELSQYCLDNDFLYIYNSFGRWKIHNANASEIQEDIVNDINSCAYVEPTHEMDSYIEYRDDLFASSNHIVVFKLKGTKDGDYYIIWQD